MKEDDILLEENDIRERIAQLPNELRKAYYAEEEKEIKDPDTYAVLNYFIAGGLHHFYLGNMVFGSINLFLMILGIVFIETFGFLFILAVLIIELPQLFRSQKIVKRHNLRIKKAILEYFESQGSAIKGLD